jgi:hypothetical protein
MTTRQIFARDAIELLRAQVEKKGADYVYIRHVEGDCNICKNYVRGPEGVRVPDCLLGHVYADLGVLHVVFETSAIRQMVRLLFYAGIEMSERAIYVFDVAQVAQDQRRTWGEALAYATRAAESCADDDQRMSTWDQTTPDGDVHCDPWST